MLPFDNRPWAKPLAATVIVITIIAAVLAPFYLRHIRHMDPPMAVLIVLLVLAIVPPNLLILRRRDTPNPDNHRPAHDSHTAYVSRPSGR